MDNTDSQPEVDTHITNDEEMIQPSDVLNEEDPLNGVDKYVDSIEPSFVDRKSTENDNMQYETGNSGDGPQTESQSIGQHDGRGDHVTEDVYGGDHVTEDDYGDVTIKVIDIPDDDDLFDFMNTDQHTAQEDELKKTELYKYLTEEGNKVDQQMEELTPYQSADEHVRDDGNDDGSDGETDSSSEESEESYDREYEEITKEALNEEALNEESQIDTQEYLHEEEKSFELPVQRFPVRQSIPKKRGRKKVNKSNVLTDSTIEKLENAKHVTNQWLKDLSIPENLTFSQPLNMQIGDLNQYLTCGMCKGYLYEASTITECMHTFCKNCIVRHCMEVSLHCPVCSILIHPTDPFVNIRLDRMIQDIVYKILPNVAETEMRRIEQFYAEHPEVEAKEIQLAPPKPKVSPKVEEQPVKQEKVHTPSDIVSLLLEAEQQDDNHETLEKKFVRVPGAATVGSVCEFLKKKLSLQDQHRVDLYCCGDAVEERQCTLDKIKQNFYGGQEDLMLLQYRVCET